VYFVGHSFVVCIINQISKKSNNTGQPESTANFLERGGDGCELRVASCEVKNFGVVFLSQFFKALPRKPATVKHVTRNRLSFFLGGGFWSAKIHHQFLPPAVRGLDEKF
jgi:hypothetical protein